MSRIIPKFLNDITHGDSIIYRGHANYEWELKPSIGRHFTRDWSEVVKYEIKSLEDFKKRAVPYIKVNPKTDIEWLCLMQHHGCPTRLLDFTSNPLIALFFASDPTTGKDGEVIAAKYSRSYENVSNDNLFNRPNSFAYYPPHITERIIGQSGCFVYARTPNAPLNGKQITKTSIPKSEKTEIRRELKELGISHSSLFPGVDGVCKDLNEELVLKLIIEDLF
ncbi:FRG domain-containing protein [Methylotenera sp. G11]|uniref:FRG domain-containing protein n=1 Tax=Methylotenera sp. G11 TaxID=1506585 RepID=UPI0006468A94|nr:FRG domain-containing protein [Methylotenera sp. G11]